MYVLSVSAAACLWAAIHWVTVMSSMLGAGRAVAVMCGPSFVVVPGRGICGCLLAPVDGSAVSLAVVLVRVGVVVWNGGIVAVAACGVGSLAAAGVWPAAVVGRAGADSGVARIHGGCIGLIGLCCVIRGVSIRAVIVMSPGCTQ